MDLSHTERNNDKDKKGKLENAHAIFVRSVIRPLQFVQKRKRIASFALASILAPSMILLLTLSILTPSLAAGAGNFVDSKFVGGLDSPTAMEFAPDGRLFVAEKGGDLRVIKDGVLKSTSFLSVPVSSSGERGLLGIAFDPDFESNGFVYVYYTTSTSPIHNRVSRFTADPANPDKALAGSEMQILNLETLSATNHNGGAIHFGSDGKLYVATGDNAVSSNSQSLSTRLGKILRINSDGTIPSGNPFVNAAGAKKEIWALGLRNPFTFAFSPISGSTLMYINDVGASSWEEINSGMAGKNYGWPTCQGACSNSNFVNPVYAYPHNGAGKAIAGAAFYEANQFPSEYKGSYFFGDYVAGFIKRLTPAKQAVDFLPNVNSPVDIKVGPDGSLYYLSIGSGEVHQVEYVTTGNSIPNAVATASPTSGQAPLNVNFDGSGSSDPNTGDVLTYSWKFGDVSSIATGAKVTHTYSAAGAFIATLTVNDGKGGTDTASVTIVVGTPPVGTINTPPVGTRYDAGDTFSFSGSGNDGQDGTLPASAFKWVILFHHNTHTHPFLIFNGVKSGSFTIPTVGESDDDVWYRIYLTVTDSSGLTHLSTRDILPNKSTITLNTNPVGLEVTLDGEPQTTPHSFVGVVGFERTLEAPGPQTLDGKTYQFQSWSDGGDATHDISTPSSATTYVATYEVVTPSDETYPITHMSDTTASSGYGVYSDKQIRAEYVSSSSQLVGDSIDQITLRLKRVGSIDGTAQVGVFNSDLSVKKQFGTISVSSLPQSYADYTYTLSNSELYTIKAGDIIGIKFTGGDIDGNWVSVMLDLDTSDPFDGEDSYRQYYSTAWYASKTQDMYMILEQTHG